MFLDDVSPFNQSSSMGRGGAMLPYLHFFNEKSCKEKLVKLITKLKSE